jgi:hypothetical protein
MTLTNLDAAFIGTVFEGVFYGLYCIVFILYIRLHTSKKRDERNNLIYPLSSLFVLCPAYFLLDFTQQYLYILHTDTTPNLQWHLNTSTSAIYGFIDFIAQAILIYRCWIVWSQKWIVIVIPSILALISLGTSLALVGELGALGVENGNNTPAWFTPVGDLSFSLSLAVNAIITGLLVFKIAKASRALRNSLARAPRRALNDFRPLVSMLVESGIALFAIQMVWVVCFSTESSGFYLVGGPIAMIYGIIPTTIVVRVGLGHSYDSQTLSVESNMRFAYADENSPTKISGNTCHWNSAISRADSKETV